MTIVITNTAIVTSKNDDLFLNENEYQKYKNDYKSFCMYKVNPPSLEQFIRNQHNNNLFKDIYNDTTRN